MAALEATHSDIDSSSEGGTVDAVDSGSSIELMLTSGDNIGHRRYQEPQRLQTEPARTRAERFREAIFDSVFRPQKIQLQLPLPQFPSPPPSPFVTTTPLRRSDSRPLASTLGFSPRIAGRRTRVVSPSSPLGTSIRDSSDSPQPQTPPPVVLAPAASMLVSAPPTTTAGSDADPAPFCLRFEDDDCTNALAPNPSAGRVLHGVPSASELEFSDSLRGGRGVVVADETAVDSDGYTRPDAVAPAAATITALAKSPLLQSKSAMDEFYWSNKFQKAKKRIDEMSPNTHNDVRKRAYGKLAKLAEDFVRTASLYARMIISELFLPEAQRTIKPIRPGSEGSGFAGGQKYSVCGIFFKIAINDKHLFANDESAAKVAQHDMKSLIVLSNLWIPDVCFPLTCMIKYRGFTALAMAKLPINAGTLVYGSCDAGNTVVADPSVLDKVKRIAERLYLCEHSAGVSRTRLYTPTDIEVHKVESGHLYMLDFARLLPPQPPTPCVLGSHLINLFRAEFLRNTRTVLCSDAYSNFIKDEAERKKHNADVDAAMKKLMTQVLPKFAQKLVEMPEALQGAELVQSMHEAGINVRLLGRIFFEVEKLADKMDDDAKCEAVCAALLREMVARVIKCDVDRCLRKAMINLRLPREGPYRTAVIELLNKVFGASKASKEYWTEIVTDHLRAKFAQFTPASRRDLRPSVQMIALFYRVTELAGLRWSKSLLKNLDASPSWLHSSGDPFMDADLEELTVKVRQLNIAEHSIGYILRMSAMECTHDHNRKKRLMKMAAEHFEQALVTDPDNHVTLRNLGDCLAALGRRESAEEAYNHALRARPNDGITLYKWAICKDAFGDIDAAEAMYMDSLRLKPKHANCAFSLADFLFMTRHQADAAEKMYKFALEIDDQNPHALNNYGIFLAVVKHDFQKALEYIRRAVVASHPSIPEHEQNLEQIQKLVMARPSPIVDSTAEFRASEPPMVRDSH